MPKPVSPELLAKLRGCRGRGSLPGPEEQPAQDHQTAAGERRRLKPGSNGSDPAPEPGQYLIGDTLCDDFIWTPILYLDAYVEWKVDSGGVRGTHYALPADAKWDPKARCYFRDNGNSVEEARDIVGLVDRDVYWLSFRGRALPWLAISIRPASALTVETDEGRCSFRSTAPIGGSALSRSKLEGKDLLADRPTNSSPPSASRAARAGTTSIDAGRFAAF